MVVHLVNLVLAPLIRFFQLIESSSEVALQLCFETFQASKVVLTRRGQPLRQRYLRVNVQHLRYLVFLHKSLHHSLIQLFIHLPQVPVDTIRPVP